MLNVAARRTAFVLSFNIQHSTLNIQHFAFRNAFQEHFRLNVECGCAPLGIRSLIQHSTFNTQHSTFRFS